MSRSRWIALGFVGLSSAAPLLFVSPAEAAVTVGSDLTRPADLGVGCPNGAAECTFAQTNPAGQFVSPIDGVIVRWRVKGSSGISAEMVRLRVIRPAAAPGAFLGAGRSEPGLLPATPPPAQIYMFATRLPVRAGDRVGLDGPAPFISVWNADPAAGAFSSWGPELEEGGSGRPPDTSFSGELLVNADVEPDADCDELGDETQDSSIDPHGCDRDPPDTTVTKAPKDKVKTKKKWATVSFEFTASEPGSTFECSLDGGPFDPCASPVTERVRAKRKATLHEFQVRATDPAGNADPTPATDDFKLKRKRR
jgi:hypothetical protein